MIEATRFDLQSGDAVNLKISTTRSRRPAGPTPTHAPRATRGGICVTDPSRLELSRDHVERVPARSYAELGSELSRELDPMHLSLGELSHEIKMVAADGYDTRGLRVDYYVKLSEAFACIVLPFSVLLFAVTGPPFAAPAHTLLVPACRGAHVLMTGVATRSANSGTLPSAAGWLPTGVFAGVVALLAARLWKQM